MDHIRRLLVDRHDGRGAVGGAVGTQKSAVTQNQRAQKRSVHHDGFLRFRHSIRPPFKMILMSRGDRLLAAEFQKHHMGFLKKIFDAPNRELFAFCNLSYAIAAPFHTDNVHLLLESHERMGEYAEAGSVSCIVFNFGYLPGGDHKKATKAASSLRAVETGLRLLKQGGLMTLCIYSGGDSGFEEKEALLQYIRTLPSGEFLVLETRYANRPGNPPIPVLIIRL